MLRDILNKSSRVNIINELHFLAPRWIRQDFRYRTQKLGPLKHDSNVLKLVQLIYSGSLEGTFWKIDHCEHKVIQNRITAIDPERLQKKILGSDRTYRDIFQILLEEHAILQNKDIAGAKRPVDISYISKLLEWFPDCRIIHAIRDPRAIYSAMALFEIRSSSPNYKIEEYLIRFKRFMYMCHRYKQAAKIHSNYGKMDNYYLSRFEDIISQPEKHIQKLCDFLEIKFEKR